MIYDLTFRNENVVAFAFFLRKMEHNCNKVLNCIVVTYNKNNAFDCVTIGSIIIFRIVSETKWMERIVWSFNKNIFVASQFVSTMVFNIDIQISIKFYVTEFWVLNLFCVWS